MLNVTIMGSGGSGGVPFAGNVWGRCNPNNPRNLRTRSSLLVRSGDVQLVIDTGPDFRQQINRAGVTGKLTAVLYTHAHADHVAGIDDLRAFCFAAEAPVPVYASEATLADLYRRDGHVFSHTGLGYPTIARGYVLQPVQHFGDVRVQAFELPHGDICSTGFRINHVGYVSDASALTPEAMGVLQGVHTFIVGTTHHVTDGQHPSLQTVQQWVAAIAPQRTYLTHLSAFLDYDELKANLPPHIDVAYDGLQLVV